MARRGPARTDDGAAFDAFRAAVGPRSAPRRTSSGAAARAHAETMAEMWLRAEGLDAALADPGLVDVLANPALADAVDRVAA